MPRDEIQRMVESIMDEYLIPKESVFACSLEKIVRMKCHTINPKDIRSVIRAIFHKEGV